MYHPFPGFTGLVLGPPIFGVVGAGSYFTKKYESYNLDPQAAPGAFEPFLARA
jgi:hypothetical protein